MKDNLLVIESPNKINTLKKYLGDDFVIMATIGHIRDLSSVHLGFNANDYSPNWIIPRSKKNIKGKSKTEIISEIKNAAKKSKNIYLASDPDREGEAIAWHVFEILSEEDRKKCKRITFNEISQTAVTNALKNPRDIDIQWVNSQFARRIMDRMIGFRLSRLVQNVLQADSAGRVQSVALKFLEDREKEIENFKEEKWWTLDITLNNEAPIILHQLNDELITEAKKNDYVQLKEVSGINFKSKQFAEHVSLKLSDKFTVYAISEPKFSTLNPKEPYKTSTLQQDGINKLSWSSKRITAVAQKLYEGISIDGDYKALISYPRTDSVRVSDGFKEQVKNFILSKFGQTYLGNFTPTKNKKTDDINVQDAHEAIRPIDINVTPDSISGKIDEACHLLYKLIWIRSVAAFMSPAKFSRVDVRFLNNGCKFYAINRQREFDGYQKIYSHYKNDENDHLISLKDFEIGKSFSAKETKINEHKTLPPARFNQASLIAALEKAGIGRPSTYSMIANVALERGYAELKNRAYVITSLGREVITKLESFFPNIINKKFTREMEENLDQIADGKERYQDYLDSFWPKFDKSTQEVYDKLKNNDEIKKKELEKVGRECPEDKGDLVYRYAKRNGKKFIGCANFPKCKYHEWLTDENSPVELDIICPKCNEHKLVRRIGRQNKPFIACSGFPKCRYIEKNKVDSKKESEDQEEPKSE